MRRNSKKKFDTKALPRLSIRILSGRNIRSCGLDLCSLSICGGYVSRRGGEEGTGVYHGH